MLRTGKFGEAWGLFIQLMRDELRGERVVLRTVGEAAAPDLVPAFNGDEDFNRLSGQTEPLSAEAVRADVLETLTMPGGRVWSIERVEDRELLGVAETALVPPPHNAWIALFIIRQEYQRQGYGREAADLLEAEFLAAPEVTRIGLGVLVHNTRALAFWERRGYAIGLKRRDSHGNEVVTLRRDRPDLPRDQAEQAARSRAQFAPTAAAYATSADHARGDDLEELANLAALVPADGVALDIATGGGHTAFAVAPYLRQVIATDITQEMLDQTAQGAATRGLDNITTQIADVHALPFADNSFALVTSRIAPHHFASLSLALREMVRVTQPGGLVVVIDLIVPEDPALDAFVNRVEQMRDPSHVRSRTENEWRQLFEDSELEIVTTEQYRVAHDYAQWIERQQVPEHVRRELDRTFLGASDAEIEECQIIVVAGQIRSYSNRKLLIAGKKP